MIYDNNKCTNIAEFYTFVTATVKNITAFLINGLNLQITHLSTGKYSCNLRISKHPVNIFLFVLVNPDNSSYITNHASGKRHILKKGMMYFRPCFSSHEVYLSETFEFVSIHFNLDICYGADIFQNSNFMEIPASDYMENLVKLMNCPDRVESLCQYKTIVYDLASKIFHDSSDEYVSAKWDNYRELFTYAKHNCSANLTVGILAEHMNLHREVFSRNFKRDTGITPKEFLTRILSKKASQLMIKPGMTLKEVAAELEFNNEYYFSRFFKKHFGISPGQYRKQLNSTMI